MNEYQLPEEPAGPVWDQHGSRWVRIPETYPSAVLSPDGGFQSGVEAVTRKEDNGPCR